MSAAAAVIPMVFLGESRRAVLQEKLQFTLKSWADHWFPELEVNVEVVTETDDSWEDQEVVAMRCGRATPLTEENADMVVIHRPGLTADLLGFGRDAGEATVGGIAAELQAKLITSFREHLMRTLGKDGSCENLRGARDCLQSAQAQRWVPVVTSVRGSRPFALLLLSPAVIALLSPARTANVAAKPLQSRRSSIRTNSLQLEAIAGYAEVAFADLASLAVGDVLVLEQGLDAPVRLSTEKGDQVVAGQLGKVGDKRAVSVTVR